MIAAGDALAFNVYLTCYLSNSNKAGPTGPSPRIPLARERQITTFYQRGRATGQYRWRTCPESLAPPSGLSFAVEEQGQRAATKKDPATYVRVVWRAAQSRRFAIWLTPSSRIAEQHRSGLGGEGAAVGGRAE